MFVFFWRLNSIQFLEMSKLRLYYVPGLISIISLPILILLFLNDFKKNKITYSIELCTPHHFSTYSKHIIDSDFIYYYKIPATRNYISIDINNSNQKDISIYTKIEEFSRVLNLKKDSTNGLKITFNNISYNSFIQTINACLKSKIETYYLLGDTFYVYFTPRGKYSDDADSNIPRIKKILLCGTGLNNGYTFKTHHDYIAHVRNVYIGLVKRYFPIYITLILLSFFSLRWNYRTIKQSIRRERIAPTFLISASIIYLLCSLLNALLII